MDLDLVLTLAVLAGTVGAMLSDRLRPDVVALSAAVALGATGREGDVLCFEGDLEDFKRRDVEPYLEILPPRAWRDTDLESPDTTVVEVVLAPRSTLVGKTPRKVHFRARYSMNVLAVWRGGEPLLIGLPDVRLEFGDALLLQGSRERRQMLREEPDLIALPRERGPAIPEVPGNAGPPSPSSASFSPWRWRRCCSPAR